MLGEVALNSFCRETHFERQAPLACARGSENAAMIPRDLLLSRDRQGPPGSGFAVTGRSFATETKQACGPGASLPTRPTPPERRLQPRLAAPRAVRRRLPQNGYAPGQVVRENLFRLAVGSVKASRRFFQRRRRALAGSAANRTTAATGNGSSLPGTKGIFLPPTALHLSEPSLARRIISTLHHRDQGKLDLACPGPCPAFSCFHPPMGRRAPARGCRSGAGTRTVAPGGEWCDS